jgi:hypothetical protein
MNPNASLLFLLTISTDVSEEVIFLYNKELEEIAPPNIFWYPKKGQNGNAEFIWEDKKLKQWLVIGADQELKSISSNLFVNKYDKIDFGKKQISFKINATNVVACEDDNIEKIKDVPLCAETIKYKFENLKTDVSFLFGQKDNCMCVEGYSSSQIIKSIYPPGFLANGFLLENLQNFILGFIESRGIYTYLRGDRNTTKGDDPQKFYGFIQSSKEFRNRNNIEIHALDSEEILGESLINTDSGTWVTDLSKTTGQGKFIIKNRTTKINECGYNFYLVKNIKIDLQVVSQSIKDMYGRVINITSDSQIKDPLVEPLSWIKDNSSDSNKAEIELSEKYTRVLLSLCKTLTISDPYLLGDLGEDNGKLKISKDQHAFFNALLLAITMGDIQELQLICNWGKTKKFCNNDKQVLISRYKSLFNDINKNITQVGKQIKVRIYFCHTPFHDRYWFGKNNDMDIVYHISNSINGIFENGEVIFTPVLGNNNYQERMKLDRRLKDSTLEIIKDGTN